MLLALFLCCLLHCDDVFSGHTDHFGALCDHLFTSIATIQGEGHRSPLVGQRVLTQGVVTALLYEGRNEYQKIDGFFIQEPKASSPLLASQGLYIYSKASRVMSKMMVRPGMRIAVRGRVKEYHGLTELTDVEAIEYCGDTVLPKVVHLDTLRLRELEVYENMRVSLPIVYVRSLTQLARYGGVEVGLGVGDPVVKQSVMLEGKHLESTLFVDESSSLMELYFKHHFRVADQFKEVKGILSYRFNRYRIYLESLPVWVQRNPRPTPFSRSLDAYVRIVVLNLNNYFNGNNQKSFLKNSRGARSQASFMLQNKKLRKAWQFLKPDIALLSEMENDGQQYGSAVFTLEQVLRGSVEGIRWRYLRHDYKTLGFGRISNVIFYNQNKVEPLGTVKVLSQAQLGLNVRPILVQKFRQKYNGFIFWVAGLHLKSKSGCEKALGLDKDQGQGCWNFSRLKAVKNLVAWAQKNINLSKIPLIIGGDFNAYIGEEPIAYMHNFGFRGVLSLYDHHPYSYLYRGRRGLLDHIFISQPGLIYVDSAKVVHMNADELPALSYQENLPAIFRQKLKTGEHAFRFSDHDPVVLELLTR